MQHPAIILPRSINTRMNSGSGWYSLRTYITISPFASSSNFCPLYRPDS